MWKEKLQKLEQKKKWDEAITFMEKVIRQNQDSVDAYLSLQYLIMNLLVEEREYDGTNRDHYIAILQKYFCEAYAKFSENPAYLYYTGRTAVMSEWYFDLDYEDVSRMIDKAGKLAPDNKIYLWNYYSELNPWNLNDRAKLRSFIKDLFNSKSTIRQELDAKGAVGAYMFDMMSYGLKYQISHLRCIDEKKLDWLRALKAMQCFMVQCIDNSSLESGIQLKNDLKFPLNRTLKAIKMWKESFKENEFKDYQECYATMMNIINEYALQYSEMDSLVIRNMTLSLEKEETVDPHYWALWLKCVQKELKKT